MNTPNTNLNKKLLEIRREVGYLNRSGKNTANDYEYSTEEDVLSVVGGLMNRLGIIMIPLVTRHDREGDVTSIEMEFEVIDTDSGESFKSSWVGWGSDKEDKGGYKAYTGATKYFLMKLFGLAFKGDDPEANGSQKKGTKPKKSRTVEQVCNGIEKIKTKKQLDNSNEWAKTGLAGYTPAQANVIKRKLEEQAKKVK